MANMDLIWLQKVVAVLSIVTVLSGIAWRVYTWLYRKTYLPVKNEYQKITDLHREIISTLPVIKEIKAEFLPNGGSSMRDVINRLDTKASSHDAKIEMLFTQNNYATFEADSKGKVTSVNRDWCNITNMLPHEARGDGWLQGVHQEDREKVQEEWNDSINQGREFYLTCRLGSASANDYQKVTINSKVIRDSKGKNLGLFGYFKNSSSI